MTTTIPSLHRLIALLFLLVWTVALGQECEVGEYDDVQEEEEDDDELDWSLWEDGTLQDIIDHLGCSERTGDTVQTQIHGKSTWGYFHKAYVQSVGADVSSLPDTFTGNSGFAVPIAIELVHPEVGRGVVAKEDIEKGALIWTSVNTAKFENADSYRHFLRDLPPDLACDVIVWAYSRHNASRDPVICVDLDEGSFVNEGATRWEENCGFRNDIILSTSGCELEFFARRDIEAGEELRVSYASFAAEVWSDLGL